MNNGSPHFINIDKAYCDYLCSEIIRFQYSVHEEKFDNNTVTLYFDSQVDFNRFVECYVDTIRGGLREGFLEFLNSGEKKDKESDEERKGIKGADESEFVSCEEKTLFSAGLKEALDQFDSLLDIPDEDFNKIQKIYDRLCLLDMIREKTQEINRIGRRDLNELIEKAGELKDIALFLLTAAERMKDDSIRDD